MKSAPAAPSNESAKTRAHSTPHQADLPGIERATEAPMMPSPSTRPAEALAMLIANEYVDQRDFLSVHGGWRLAAAVFELRALGWHIETEHIPVVLDNGEAASIARYRLDRAALSPHQGGYITPTIAAWLAIAGPLAAVALAILLRWLA